MTGYAHRILGNRILQRLSKADRALVDPHLSAIDLPLHKLLEQPHKHIEHVYFLDSGFANVVASSIDANHRIEVALIGREGVTGLAVLMGTDRTPHETRMQTAGAGRRIATLALNHAMEKSATLRRTLLNYGHAFFVQTSQTALANGHNHIHQRLARWLCMAHDRVDRDELTVTHEFLAKMLGVRRPGVTLALGKLEGAGLVSARRGHIAILNRTGLAQNTGGTYGISETEFQRLFG